MIRFRGQKIVIAPDKFKGSLTAFEAAAAIRDGILAVTDDLEIISAPIADGGEGTAEVLCDSLNGKWREISVHDPLKRSVSARYCWSESDSVAVLEMSEASGMWRLKPEELEPMRANTFGTGELIREAAEAGAQKIIVGLGGSATTDGGIGVAAALGFRFFDPAGNELPPNPGKLDQLERIDVPENLKLPEIIAAVDVDNPLLGSNGAAEVYSPQKGADPQQIEQLEKNLKRLAEIVERDLGFSNSDQAGAGAAGGLGFGLAAFCGAKICVGFDLVAEAIELEEKIRSADLVITGEGKLDAQTLHGKGPAGVGKLARKHGRPIIAFAGSVSDKEQLNDLFDATIPITPSSVESGDALKNAAVFLRRSVERTMKELRQ